MLSRSRTSPVCKEKLGSMTARSRTEHPAEITALKRTAMKTLDLIRKTCLLLVAAIAYFALSPAPAYAQMHMHHFSMPLNQVVQGQAKAGLYTDARRQAEVKLTDALYETDPDRALALLEEAARLDPTFEKPVMQACDVEKARKRYVAAAAQCREATKRLPEFGAYEMKLAEVEELAEQPAQSAASFARAETIYQLNAAPDQAAVAGTRAARLRRAFNLR